MSPRYQSTSARSSRPDDLPRPFLHTLPVRFETPTASAARVKLMPPETSSRYLALRASCISLSFS